MSKVELLLTKDGSHTVYNNKLDESYHAYNGALTESEFVYIENGFRYFLASKQTQSHTLIRILEFGFGTGLNTVLTLKESIQSGIHIDYVSTEPCPLPFDIIDSLNHGKIFNNELNVYFSKIHQAQWNTEEQLTSSFRLHKVKSKLEDLPETTSPFDIIFYDAFAPSKQPDAWHIKTLQKCKSLLKDDGLIVTYCANGQFKRDLKSLGFKLDQIEGPMGRKEMTRAWKQKTL
ncbi:tRNA (5-methylaminomethyl-2-thiouridine)(34)-methyltransferase MnmD [Shewanella sp. 202IG2-18]|uniref:tRNA (5-methylaminomethyl-2-thiouridine)(34)-methyltransferase MnmD n=1 Tax=Parashewanella hymeniacidonis TaxID=2807618 RepID=UPI00195F266B|nr:tRNA (5-methylaminomethyl-2-thiouridine)(34)-methyltransferase MnmD [Parashewanella hymeniacidonis]MBM7072687.1 tRNA (5-methylaminomethyl-2-thiouridine)(34)-methyltransferase MnmD [Parashewanella hymeniacidonis]